MYSYSTIPRVRYIMSPSGESALEWGKGTAPTQMVLSEFLNGCRVTSS